MSIESVDPTKGKGLQTLSIPISLDVLSTSALDLVSDFVAGFEGYIVGLSFLTTKLGAGAGASQSISITIDGVATEGGVLSLLLADTTPVGKIKAATAFTGKNKISQTSLIDVKLAASGTAFTGGSGALLITFQNVQNF